MELTQIEIFAVVAEAGSFSKAADRLYVSHSTVSRAVSALEREMGARLVARDCRGIALTRAGRALLDGGLDLLARTEALKRRIAEMGEEICTDTERRSG